MDDPPWSILDTNNSSLTARILNYFCSTLYAMLFPCFFQTKVLLSTSCSSLFTVLGVPGVNNLSFNHWSLKYVLAGLLLLVANTYFGSTPLCFAKLHHIRCGLVESLQGCQEGRFLHIGFSAS